MNVAAATTGTWPAVLLLASLSAATSWLGVVLALRIGDRPRAVAAGIGFSAGIMLVISGAELLPEAYRAGVELYPSLNAAFLAFAAGAMSFVSLHELLPMAHRLGRLREFAAGAAVAIPIYGALSLLITR